MPGPSLPESITGGVTTGHVAHHEAIHDLLNEFDTTDQASTKGDLLVFYGGTIKRLAIGANTQVLTADSAQTAGLKWGVGGDPYAVEPGLKPPASPHADDDEFDDANATDPTTTGWSWGNQQSCTAAINSGVLGIDATTSTLGGIHGLFKAAPTTGDLSITTRATGTIRRDFHHIGIVFLWGTLTTPTDFELVRLTYAGGDTEPYWSQYTAYGTFNVNRGQVERTGHYPQYLRLEWDDSAGTVLGLWTPRATASTLSFAPLSTAQSKGSRPDFMGLEVGDDSTSNNLPIGLFDFFRVNWTPDA